MCSLTRCDTHRVSAGTLPCRAGMCFGTCSGTYRVSALLPFCSGTRCVSSLLPLERAYACARAAAHWHALCSLYFRSESGHTGMHHTCSGSTHGCLLSFRSESGHILAARAYATAHRGTPCVHSSSALRAGMCLCTCSSAHCVSALLPLRERACACAYAAAHTVMVLSVFARLPLKGRAYACGYATALFKQPHTYSSLSTGTQCDRVCHVICSSSAWNTGIS